MTIDGRYVVESVLGEGGMGIVYLARHRVIGKRVALKVLRQDFARDKEITDRFLQEARAASSIGNPHIVDISDFGQLPDGSTYFAMEWLNGAPLTKLIGHGRTVPLERLAHIGRQIADGLAAAHDTGIVHRDLKPDNVYLVGQGSEADFVKILDFGIAKVANAASRHTRAGTVFGTPHYMSPEQASGAPVDRRTDIYALGVILYEMAAGQLPFDAENVMGILTQHVYKRPSTIRSIVQSGQVSPALEAVVLKALSKDPADRYQTMQQFSLDLQKLEQGLEPDAVDEMMARSASMFPPELFQKDSAAGSAEETSPLASPVHARSRWRAYAGAGLAALALCSLVIALTARGSRSKPPAPTASGVAAPTAATDVAPPGVAPPKTPAPETVEVLLATEPLDAHVFRGKDDLGSPPMTVNVEKGQTVLFEVRRQGFKSQSVTVDGSAQKVTIKLVAGNERARAPAKKTKSGTSWQQNEIVNPWAKPRK